MMVDWCAVGGIPGNFALRGTLPWVLFTLGQVTLKPSLCRMQIPRERERTRGPDVHRPICQQDNSRPTIFGVFTGSLSPTGYRLQRSCADHRQRPQLLSLAVLACQRANAEKNKGMRENWIRLCGTYQSRGGILATNEDRSALLEITTLYFAPPPKTQPNNPLGAMLSSMLSGGAPGGAPQPGSTGPTAPGLD
ncbi:hypothetical protein JVT61DRAFT_9095 [Boletus reticuloceps]|uniref:Uncharacterized protein n=1 Tax=Boletus reticuloceps TaxID=495285 RepID=A0A8I2YH18_9AGAM|nr:hypothetical protein JVT61DRAFT_9095 [Boletus reticuloceps]